MTINAIGEVILNMKHMKNVTKNEVKKPMRLYRNIILSFFYDFLLSIYQIPEIWKRKKGRKFS